MCLQRTNLPACVLVPAIVLGGCSVGLGQSADLIEAHGVIENFFVADSGKRGAQNRLSWGELNLSHKNWRSTISYLVMPQSSGTVRRTLDEAYLEGNFDGLTVKAGRMRPAIGLYSWSDLLYTPIIQLPMVRFMPTTPQTGILRQDRGIEIGGGTPALHFQVALVDTVPEPFQFTPKRMDHVVARGEAYFGNVILGVSGMTKLGSGVQGSQVGAIDLRWTPNRFIVRGELVKGIGSGLNSRGYAFDVYYRPVSWANTQLGIRHEAFKSYFSPSEAKLTQVGVRQVISEHFTITTNYGWGNSVAPATSMRGWSIQLRSSIRF